MAKKRNNSEDAMDYNARNDAIVNSLSEAIYDHFPIEGNKKILDLSDEGIEVDASKLGIGDYPAQKEIQMEALLNEFKGPSTPVTLDVVGSEDFQLSFTIPGHTADNVKAAVHEQMKEFFVDSARFILQSKAYGRYIKDPDAKDQNPMVTLGGQ